VLYVRQRADRYNEIGAPKSEAGLVFANGKGNPEGLANIRNRGLVPAWRAAGITGRYEGMHSLPHFYAPWPINRKVDGGLGWR
jgi:integrase